MLVGFGMSDALADRSNPVALVSEVGLWAGWFAGLVTLLAPSTASLTALRLLAPSALASTLLAAVSSGIWNAATVGAISITAVVLGLVLLPQTGDVMVNGSSYGPERRMALRPPAALLLGPVQLAWLVVYGGLVGGSLLLAAKNYLLGVPVLAFGIAGTFFAVRSLHQLSRRWIVFVPAGFVIHDYFALAESLLIRRPDIASLGPVPLDQGELLDLSGGAQGLALLVEFREKTPMALRAKKEIQTFPAQRVVFTPTLPGQLLHEARVRGITIA